MSEYVAELSETVYTANVNEPHIVIADDRSVLVPDELKEIAVQFDHNIETVTFDCPRYWDEHDLSKMHIFINYKCANGRLDGYLAENVEVDADDESIIHFTWTLKENITCANGKICFLVCAKKSNEEGVLQNRWNSKPCNDCYVVEGLDVDVSEEIEQSLDLVEQILLHLDTSAAEAHACAKRAEVAAEEARSAADNAVSSVKENFDVIRDEKITEIASATGVEIANVETAASEATAEAEAQIEAKGAAVLATIPEEYTETYQRALRNESRISRNDKRITNLEQGITPDPYHVDDTVAYSKDVPANALPFAEVNKVGGRTLKWNQLMDTNQIRTATHNGITLTFNGDGSITVNGQATERATFNGAGAKPVQIINGHRYYINGGNVTVHVGWAINSIENGVEEQIVTATEDFSGYPTIDVFSTETVFSNQTFFPKIVDLTVMYGAGNEPTSVDDFRFTSGYEPYDEGSLRSAPVTEGESVGADGEAVLGSCPIPEAVRALDGYGWGVSDTVYNYIDLETEQFAKRVGKVVFDGTENFKQWMNGDMFLGLWLEGIDYDYSNGLDIRGVCNHYDVGVGGSFGVNSVRFRQQGDSARWYFYDSALTSLSAWKARISELSASGNPLTVYYKLAEPVITDISDLLPEDNYIPVEGGGTVTMVNEYGFAVPSEITYALKEAE